MRGDQYIWSNGTLSRVRVVNLPPMTNSELSLEGEAGILRRVWWCWWAWQGEVLARLRKRMGKACRQRASDGIAHCKDRERLVFVVPRMQKVLDVQVSYSNRDGGSPVHLAVPSPGGESGRRGRLCPMSALDFPCPNDGEERRRASPSRKLDSSRPCSSWSLIAAPCHLLSNTHLPSELTRRLPLPCSALIPLMQLPNLLLHIRRRLSLRLRLRPRHTLLHHPRRAPSAPTPPD